MKNIICIILFGLLIVGCTTNKYLPKKYKIGEVEYFDIEEFERIKNKKYNEYYLNKKDTIEIDLFRNSDGEYLDLRTVYSSNYILRKKFYPSGIIKERGKKNYPGDDFKIGIWEYFDESGNLIKTEDMDKRYKVSYKQALRKVFWRYGFLKRNLKVEIGLDGWILTNIKGCRIGKSAAVNMVTGKVKRVKIKVIHMNYKGKDGHDYIEESRKKKNTDSKPDSTDTN